MKAQAEEASALTREEEQAEVIRRLEEDIIFGRFAPGSRLVEDTLMSRYGASRHFVRQGLFQLERQGIVLREKNIGATVRFYSADEVRQIYEVREMLTRQAELMIELLRGRDSWAFAQLCVDHMQYSKSDYLARIAGDKKAD